MIVRTPTLSARELRAQLLARHNARLAANAANAASRGMTLFQRAWATPAVSAPPSKEKTVQQSDKTQHTLKTVLQLAVAELVEFLNNLPNAIGGNSVTAIRMGYVDPSVTVIGASVNITISHNGVLCANRMRSPFLGMSSGHHRLDLSVSPFVAYHAAVQNALVELNPQVDLRRDQFPVIHDYDAYVKERGLTLSVDNCAASFPIEYEPFANLFVSGGMFLSPTLRSNTTPFPFDTPLWKIREHMRLQTGVYDPLPDDVKALLPENVLEDMIPHLAHKPGNAGMIAYTQSPVAGQLDRQQVIKAGRFIRQHNPDITDEQVKQAAATVTAAFCSNVFWSSEADDFERVYRQGPHSCMAYGPTGKYFGRLIVDGVFYHPCRVYAHPDNHIQIVWMELNGRIIARAVVNTQTKKYPRIYGTDSVTNSDLRLANYLHELGYVRNDYALSGQIIHRVSPDKFPDAIICPYIDSSNLGAHVKPDRLVIAECDGYDSDHETGCLCSFNTTEMDSCSHCGEYANPEDMRSTYDGEVCEDCVDSYYTHVYCLNLGDYDYVCDSESFYYDVDRDEPVFLPSHLGLGRFGYVQLNDDYYNESDPIAPQRQCTELAAGGYVMDLHLTENELFINDADDLAYPMADWAVLDGDLVPATQIDENRHDETDDNDSDYPMLDHYVTRTDEESEEGEAA